MGRLFFSLSSFFFLSPTFLIRTEPHSNRLFLLYPPTHPPTPLPIQQVCQVLFMGVPNIHVMRKSWDALEALCYTKEVNSASFGLQVTVLSSHPSTHPPTNPSALSHPLLFSFSSNQLTNQCTLQVEGTRWLYHIHKLLSSALFIAHLMHNQAVSVLVHCSDG